MVKLGKKYIYGWKGYRESMERELCKGLNCVRGLVMKNAENGIWFTRYNKKPDCQDRLIPK